MALPQQQYAYRAQKSLGLVGGAPTYDPLDALEKPEGTARTWRYSPDGNLWVCAVPDAVCIYDTNTAQAIREFSLPNIVEVGISPKGNFLSTWERPAKLEDGSQHKNLRVFSIETGEQVASFSQKSQEGWDLQYTPTETHALRLVGPDIQVYHPADWAKGIADKLHVEGMTNFSLSPGANPSVAVFVAEKKGAPASVKVYHLTTLSAPPSVQKSFFKADRIQFKWNSAGTQVLFMTHCDVDKSNKSYYGEQSLYLLSASGQFDCRVTLDKEGPIHDFAWNPNGKEFGVVYGFMPAKTVLFDQRVRTVFDYGMGPHNFIAFNPQGRLVILAGFGNLAGKMEIHDRRSLTKVTTIDAPNTSVCEWSPDGQYILTATLSPRLRVDNGIKVWHCTSSTLIHVHLIEELYQAGWRPLPTEKVPPFPVVLPATPAPSPSAVATTPTSGTVTPSKPAGAYRPPGARGTATPSIFKREDEGGIAMSNGAATPPRSYANSPVPGAPNGYGRGDREHNGYGRGENQNGRGRQRHVPGAPPMTGSPGQGGERGGYGQDRGPGQQGDRREKNNKKGKKQRDGPGGAGGANGSTSNLPSPRDESTFVVDQAQVAEKDPEPTEEAGPDPAADALAKKIRNLTKKLKAIEELKEKAKRGEKLEVTQIRKMDGEVAIRKELGDLGANLTI